MRCPEKDAMTEYKTNYIFRRSVMNGRCFDIVRVRGDVGFTMGIYS